MVVDAKSLDYFGKVGRGKSRHRPRNDPALYGGPYPFIQTADITNSDLYVTSYSQTYSEAGLSQSKLWEPGVLCIVNAGVNTGDSSILGIQACFPDSVISFSANPKRCDVRFIKYFLDSVKSGISSITMGATQDNLSVSKLLTIKVPAYPLEMQRKIAGILSAYDDLIENNRRRIAILERMAEELYREWFVRMRFPGYQNTKFVKGVPEGWEVLSFDRAVHLKPNESLNSGEHYPFVPMEQLSCTSMYFEYAEKRKSPSGPRFRNGDVLFPRITPSVENGKRGFVSCLADDEIGIGSTEFIVMRQKKISAEHIYFLTISKEFRTHAEQSMVGASGRQRVHEKCFSSFLVQIPCESARKQFEMDVQPIFRQISLLAKTAKELERHRTTLLGRLISSRCPVEHLKILSPIQVYERSEQTVKQELAHA